MLLGPEELLERRKEFKVVEVTYGQYGHESYLEWHVPGAVQVKWSSLLHPLMRDFGPRERIEKALGSAGVSNDDPLVLYSDLGNRYAFYAFWVLRAFGHREMYVLNGGKSAWDLRGYPKETEVRRPELTRYEARDPDWRDRIYVWELLSRLRSFYLIDVRYREEFEGKVSAPPEHPNEEAQTSGHIPGAVNIPWNTFFDEVTEELLPPEKVKLEVPRDREVVVYCRTGARASLVWFYLKFLLRVERVRLYDGSWSEWGNMVGTPVERG